MNATDLDHLTRRLAATHAQLNATELSRVLGWKSPWIIAGLKIAARYYGDSPFVGKYATVAEVRAWLKRHPDFVASHHLRKKPPQPRVTNPPSRAAGKSDGSSRKHGPQTPSPATPAPQLEPSW